jgi:hypothetical protein
MWEYLKIQNNISKVLNSVVNEVKISMKEDVSRDDIKIKDSLLKIIDSILVNINISWNNIVLDVSINLWLEESKILDYKNYLIKQKDLEIKDQQRLYNLNTLQSALEQYYYTNYSYPVSISKWVLGKELPMDINEWQTINGCKFWYMYGVWKDDYWLENGNYKLSACMESDKYKKISITDGWIYDNKYEIWNGVYNKNIIDKYIIDFK